MQLIQKFTSKLVSSMGGRLSQQIEVDKPIVILWVVIALPRELS